MEIEDIRLIAIQTALEYSEAHRKDCIDVSPADILRWSRRIVDFVTTGSFDPSKEA